MVCLMKWSHFRSLTATFLPSPSSMRGNLKREALAAAVRGETLGDAGERPP